MNHERSTKAVVSNRILNIFFFFFHFLFENYNDIRFSSNLRLIVFGKYMTKSMLNLQVLCFEYVSFLKREIQWILKGKITTVLF